MFKFNYLYVISTNCIVNYRCQRNYLIVLILFYQFIALYAQYNEQKYCTKCFGLIIFTEKYIFLLYFSLLTTNNAII